MVGSFSMTSDQITKLNKTKKNINKASWVPRGGNGSTDLHSN